MNLNISIIALTVEGSSNMVTIYLNDLDIPKGKRKPAQVDYIECGSIVEALRIATNIVRSQRNHKVHALVYPQDESAYILVRKAGAFGCRIELEYH